MAHRAGPLYKLENTIPAMKECFNKYENEMVEIDVHLTKDKKMVVYHDYELTRIYGNDIKVNDTIYERDFKKPLEKIKIHFNLNSTLNTKESVKEIGDGPIHPLLKDVLAEFPNSYFNIDLKDDTLESANMFIQIIKEAKCESRVNIGCNNGPLMKHLRRSLKGASFWACEPEIQRLFVAYLLGFLPYIDLHFDSYLPPYVDQKFSDWETHDPYVKNSKFTIFLFNVLTWTAPFIYPHLVKRGIVVIPWTVNSEDALENLVKIGATGAISDDPKLIQKVVKNMGVELDRKMWVE